MSVRRRVAVIAGDGIGPEVMDVGVDLLTACAEAEGFELEVETHGLGAERYLEDGTTLPTDLLQNLQKRSDAVLLGALGDPRVPDMRHARDILFGLRFGLDLYANVRPVRCLHPDLMPLKGVRADEVDFVVFRENTEGLYVGAGGVLRRGTADEVATQESINTRRGVERILRAAFDHAVADSRSSVVMADKHNALRHAHDLWHRTFLEVAEDYPDVRARHLFIDALCYELVRDPRPFEVIVTCNLFGDIVTDLAAGLQGGLGMAASGSFGAAGTPPVFEPVHGSAPPLAGRDVANPMAMALTVGMLLEHWGHARSARAIERACHAAVASGATTPDLGGKSSTSEVGRYLVASLG